MNICDSRYDLINKYKELYYEVGNILRNGNLDFETLKHKLIEKGFCFKDEELFLILHNLISNEKQIIRHEFWNKTTQYELLDNREWESSFQSSYYSFEDEQPSNKIFLLISDTHIGNNEIFNPKLLHNIYDFGIKKGATKCLHLGDLFNGNQQISSILNNMNYSDLNDFEKEFYRQLELFINEYPKAKELDTYCLIGNHDKIMNEFLKSRDWWSSSDLRKLSIYNSNFYMFPRSEISTKFNNKNFHFSHKLYMNFLMNDFKLDSLKDIEEKQKIVGDLMLDADYDVLISGHLHKGIIYTSLDYFKKSNKLYLGVPSTSNINIGGVVGYLINMNLELNCMEILLLTADNNLNIFESDRFIWNFREPNKTYCKTL